MTHSRVAWPHEFDMNMWKFVIENLDEQKPNKWEEFVRKTNSQRFVSTVYSRFQNNVLPKLPGTRFHVETKLKLCQKYDIKVEGKFLEELQEGAEVKLTDGTIESFQLKPDTEPNRDLALDEKEFRGLMDPIVSPYNSFTEDEEREIWKFALENCEQYTTGGKKFWEGLVTRLNSDRDPRAFSRKFNSTARNLHQMNFSVEDKLKLYKCFRIGVQEADWKMLRERADLTVKGGIIKSYELKNNGRPEKRKNSSEALNSAVKKPRNSGEEEDPIYERTDANDPDMIEPNVEANVGAENEDEIQDVVTDNEEPRDAGGMEEEHVVQQEERNELIKMLQSMKETNSDQRASEDQEKTAQKMIKTINVLDQANKQCENTVEKMQDMEERVMELMQKNAKEQDKKMEKMNQKQTDRLMEWMQENAKEQAEKTEEVNKEQTNRLEEVVRNGMQEMKATVSEQNMAGMAGIAALNTKMDVLRREVRNEEAAFLELIRSVYSTESPELDATVKRIEELIPMISEEKRNIMLLNICTTVKSLMEMTLL